MAQPHRRGAGVRKLAQNLWGTAKAVPFVVFFAFDWKRSIPRLRTRDTFGHGPKSVQKGRLNLRFKNPRTLSLLLDCDLMPRVRGTRLISYHMTNRLSSCAAAAGIVNGRN